MAIYHLSVKLITRTTGRSATAAAAYRAGEKIHDNRTGQTFDYSKKKEVTYRRIFAPPNTPQWMKDREQLWNAVEQSETRKDAQVAREIEVALPIELSPSQHIILLERFVHTQLTSKGMIADVCIHNKPGNPHCHILLTTRDINITNDGFGQKNRTWNSKEQLEEWREQWAKHCNRRLSIASSKSRIDHRSLQDQGFDQIPTVHVGANCHAMDKRGITSRRELNTLIKEKNMSNEKNKQFIASLKLEGEAELIQQEIVQAKKSKHLFLNPTDFNNSKKYREAIFARTYIPILLEIFADYCTGVDEIETDIGTCFQINLNGGGKVFDYGSQIKVASGTEEEVKVAIKLAVEKGWQGIHLTGSDEFKSKVFVEAVLSGAFPPEKITGYKPSKTDLEVIRDCKPTLKITNDSNVIKSYVVDKSDGSGTSSAEQVHLPRLKI